VKVSDIENLPTLARVHIASVKNGIVDIAAFVGLVRAYLAKLESPETLSNMSAWRAKVAAWPSIAG
jgi:hypothetical protein